MLFRSEEFLQKMQLAGYEVRQGKHLSFRAPEQKNFTYMKSLGSYYSEENVRIRLAKNHSKVKTPKHLSRDCLLYTSQMMLISPRSTLQIPGLSAGIHAPSYNSKYIDNFLSVFWLILFSNLSLQLPMKITVWMDRVRTSV